MVLVVVYLGRDRKLDISLLQDDRGRGGGGEALFSWIFGGQLVVGVKKVMSKRSTPVSLTAY